MRAEHVLQLLLRRSTQNALSTLIATVEDVEGVYDICQRDRLVSGLPLAILFAIDNNLEEVIGRRFVLSCERM
jgi:hypothetical protein